MAEYAFDAVKVKNECVSWIRNWFEQNGKNCNAVIGISGGKDSSVVAALCVESLGKERVIGVMMPNDYQDDIDDAMAIIDHLGIKKVMANIHDAENGIYAGIVSGWIDKRNMKFDISSQTRINLPPRLRMAMLYAISQSCNGRVANTCNLSEDWIGYSTRYGDAAGDFAPLANLTSEEVMEIGIICGIPEYLAYKTPSDGLCGKTDEDNFGFSYKVLNKYIREGICEDENVKKKIDSLHKKNMFKLMPMPCFPVDINCSDNIAYGK